METEINLGSIQKTLLFPLWGRAVESRSKNPKLVDKKAEELMDRISYDFTKLEKNISSVSQLSWIARSIYFDQKIQAHLEQFPEAAIINIGCGLDTTYERVDNGKLHWYDLDFPDVIELRRKYINEDGRRKTIGCSVLEDKWFSEISHRDHPFFLMGGVIYYLAEIDIRNMFARLNREFESYDFLLDYCSPKGVQMANQSVIKKGGLSQSSNLVWGTEDIHKISEWDLNIHVVHDMPMFNDFIQKTPLFKRIGMYVSDKMKMMSVCHLQIE